MFGLFASVEKKMRANASNWLELADKIYHYRRDQLSEAERIQLQQRSEALRGQLREKADASKLKLGIESLEEVLRRTGGTFYPKSTIQEYVEFFLVAAIVVLGVRTYFLQPFKIPTNSMYPSYYGMTPEVYPDASKAPGPLMQAARFVLFGAQHHKVVAPVGGKIGLPVASDGQNHWRLIYNEKPGRKWLILPTTLREYVIFIDDRPVTIDVPGDFDFDWTIRDYFKLTPETLAAKARAAQRGNANFRLAVLDKEVERGDVVMRFDVLTGDQLFVDRFSYHFIPPKVGEGFVFRTVHLDQLHPMMHGPTDQYYIKRLAGLPGDRIEIREPVLYRNGSPITGSTAYEKNAHRQDNYPGYRNLGLLSKGEVVTVPPDHFMALGDNSASSLDSRYWGYVPKQDVVGRPLFIYFPFTRRWGPAH
ncbi:signal peptidase I [Opitutaceae bacterium EW11]|nr:signal peptidase I [Opitutaceae bacterium EW11]